MKKIFSIIIVTLFLITSLNTPSYTEEIDIKDLSLYKNKSVLIILKDKSVIKCKITGVSDQTVVCIKYNEKIKIILLEDINKVFLFEPETMRNDRKNETKKKNYSSYNEMLELDFPLSNKEFKIAMYKKDQLSEEERRNLYIFHTNDKSNAHLACLFNSLLIGCGLGSIYQGDLRSFAMCIGGDLCLVLGTFAHMNEDLEEGYSTLEVIGLSLMGIGLAAILISTFYMPYRYDDRIDEQLEKLFLQKENQITELPKIKGFRAMISESDINVKKGMNNRYNVALPLVIIDF